MPLLRTNADLRALLARARTVAVVGLSGDPARDSHGVARYLEERGYRILCVNPTYSSALGKACHPSLADLPAEDLRAVDIVLVFRRPEAAAEVAREAARLKLPCIWFQLGVATPEAVAEAERAGMTVVKDSCMKVAHQLLMG